VPFEVFQDAAIFSSFGILSQYRIISIRYALAMFSPVSTKSDSHQTLTNPHGVEDVRQLEERTNSIRFGIGT
jgi:hypothetical protein